MSQPTKWTEEAMNARISDIIQGLSGESASVKSMCLTHINDYLHQKFMVTSDNIQTSLSTFQTRINDVIHAILSLQEDSVDYHQQLGAIQIWFVYLDQNWPVSNLENFFPRLVKVLLVQLRYLGHVGLDNSYPYNEEASMFWTVREFSASCINKLANKMGPIFLAHLMPLIEDKIMDAKCAGWEKETAILALGTVAKHCMSSLGPHLTKLAPALMQLLRCPSVPVGQTTVPVGQTTNWAICCCKQIIFKVCPMIDIPDLIKWDRTTEFDPARYFSDWIESNCAPEYCKMREDQMELARLLDHITPENLSKWHDFIVLKLVWLGQTEDDTLPDCWMPNFGRYITQRSFGYTPIQEPTASFYFELNPVFSEETGHFLPLQYNFDSSDLVKTERKVLGKSLANEGKRRTDFMRLCKRVVVGLLILGISGNKLIDSYSMVKFFVPYEHQEELRINPTVLNPSRRQLVNHIHEIPAGDLWGFEVVKYQHSYNSKIYFQVNAGVL